MHTLEQEMLDSAGSRMAAEIDFNVLADMLCQIGWRKVILKPMTWEAGATIDAWTAAHIKGPFETMGLVWIFEQEQDANWFALRWL
jgi:hypothetical protein